jgi:hypothetical protein
MLLVLSEAAQQHGLSHGYAISSLVKYEAPIAVGHLVGQFDAPDNRSGVHDEGMIAHFIGDDVCVDRPSSNKGVHIHHVRRHSLGLDTKHHDSICAVEGCGTVIKALDGPAIVGWR